MLPYTNLDKNPPSRATTWVRHLCVVSVLCAFAVGLTIGVFIPLVYLRTNTSSVKEEPNSTVIRGIFLNNSYSRFPSVSFPRQQLQQQQQPQQPQEPSALAHLIQQDVFWGGTVEAALPEGYRSKKHTLWSSYLQTAEAVKMETGCGRMQNRLVTFRDGVKGCVRYRQNTDQIQGELFSFYLARVLNLPNLAPSAISVVDLKSKLWQKLRNEIAAAQWNSNRPIVLTQYISDLNPANIPGVFRPVDRHLNKLDVLNMTRNPLVDDSALIKELVELAQWSDLIVFDYLTANLDRIVNNLYNFQWNANIMEAPAHNLARKTDSDLLIFLDNESGLLHGYRLLKKYEVYHSILLENLCVFRRSTAETIAELRTRGNVGDLLKTMFESENDETIKDVLPTIPDKSVKILNERIERVHDQISKCQSVYGNT
ncbi:extracellular serine/threonine protein kinase four-jointed [Aethina tumida]|uniref:extracellular serine/threonine protein kinase four-jointed n=1 Tax=Aethina tumida TaxID=116153 RepID=UPI0021486ED2|nr:extracellular serine/threonine protein kinase four-jointed [Aethina tumida]